ncbi:MAG: FkbM family methyltransferase [Elainellaceae cyanobacterium]
MAFFLNKLKENGHLEQVHMTIFSVGSRKLSSSDDFGNGNWNIFAPHLTIYGFDADADACDAANEDLETRQIAWTEKHIPIALADDIGESTLYVTNNPMCSSLYPPNEPFLNRFVGLPELVTLDFTIDLETTTLDIFSQEEGIEIIDFLKVDVQGAELLVFKGGERSLKNVLAIQTEVSFSPLYLDQPLFSDVDTYLRAKGFALFGFLFPNSMNIRRRSPVRPSNRPGQLLWADAIYLKDLLADEVEPSLRPPQALLKLACIADTLGFPDYALEILEYLTLNYGEDSRFNVSDSLIESLTALPELRQTGLSSLPIVQSIKDFISKECIKNHNLTV